MKPPRRKSLFVLVTTMALLLALGTLPANAASPSTATVGADGRPLSAVTTVAGSGAFGNVGGDALRASFRSPSGLAVAADGTVIVADTYNNRIRALAAGTVVDVAGFTSLTTDPQGRPIGALLDGSAERSAFRQPAGLAVDGHGNIVVADAANHAIRRISPNGQVRTVAGNGLSGYADGRGDAARFYAPSAVAVAADGTMYVADTLNHVIRAISPAGDVTTLNARASRIVEVFPGYVVAAGDFRDGPLDSALFNEPSGLALDADGNLYVADAGNQRIRYIDLKARTVTTVAGGGPVAYDEAALYAAGGYADGPAAQARFHFPKGLAVTDDGGLVIADSMNHAVRYLDDGNVVTLAGDGLQGDQDGVNGKNRLEYPTAVAVLPGGDIVIADTYNNKIRQFTLYELPANAAGPDITIVLGDAVLQLDVSPELVSDRVLVPVRALSDGLGVQAEFSADGESVQLIRGNRTVKLAAGERTMERAVGERSAHISLDIAPFRRGGDLFVPIRFVAEAFGYDVDWAAAVRAVVLR